MKIPLRYVIELGLIRKQDKCAKCNKKMDVKDYNIQLCKACRIIELDKYTKETMKEFNNAVEAGVYGIAKKVAEELTLNDEVNKNE